MKKTTILLAMACLLNFAVKAQDDENCVHKGTSIVDVYYGFPNLYGLAFKTFVQNNQSATTNVSNTSFGPIGFKYEYLLAHFFGLGLDFNYSTYTVKYDAVNDDQNGNPTLYHYSFSTPAIRAMLAANFHFVRSKRIDFYGAVKTGYYNRTFAFTSDQPGYNFAFKNFIPIAFRLETGIRYFFIPNLGVHVNVGLGGGPLAAVGVSAKF